MEIQVAYKHKLAVQLQAWSAHLNLLKARAEIAAADRQAKRAQLLYKLRLRQRAGFEKMHELKKAGGEVWEQVRETAGNLWKELKTGVADAHSSLK